MDTTTTPAIEFGVDVDAAFNPYIDLRPITDGVVNLTGPTLGDVMSGASCNPQQLLVKGKHDFVSGGFNRSTAFTGITVEHGMVVTTGQSSLGVAFEEYLHNFKRDALIELVNDANNGVDVTRDTDLYPDFVDKVRPPPGEALDKIHHREFRVRNSASVSDFALFVAEKITEMVANGGVRHLGTIAEVRANERVADPPLFSRTALYSYEKQILWFIL
jgi:hypothetical protein